jgi:hypothetical protein
VPLLPLRRKGSDHRNALVAVHPGRDRIHAWYVSGMAAPRMAAVRVRISNAHRVLAGRCVGLAGPDEARYPITPVAVDRSAPPAVATSLPHIRRHRKAAMLVKVAFPTRVDTPTEVSIRRKGDILLEAAILIRAAMDHMSRTLPHQTAVARASHEGCVGAGTILHRRMAIARKVAVVIPSHGSHAAHGAIQADASSLDIPKGGVVRRAVAELAAHMSAGACRIAATSSVDGLRAVSPGVGCIPRDQRSRQPMAWRAAMGTRRA